MVLEDWLRKGLAKRDQLALYCTREDKTLWQKLEYIKRKWPSALARRKDLEDILWWCSQHSTITRPPRPAPPPAYLVIPPRELTPFDPWVPNWTKMPWEDNGRSLDMYNSLSLQEQQRMFNREHPEIWIDLGVPRVAKQTQVRFSS
jgi:hypothetical protein